MSKNLFFGLCALACASCAVPSQKSACICGEWNVVSISGQEVVVDSTLESAPFLGFDVKAGLVYGSLSCNKLTGSLTIDTLNKTIDFGATGSTKMMCANMQVEDAMLAALAQTKGYNVSDSTLELTNEQGEVVMNLTKKNVCICGEWNVETIDGKEVNIAEADTFLTHPYLVFNVKENTVSGNLSCNELINSTIVVDAQNNALKFEQVNRGRMMCPNMEIERAMANALPKVVAYKATSLTLGLIDAEGNVVMTLVKK